MIKFCFFVSFRTFCIIPSKEQTVISDIVKRLCDNDFCLNDCGMYELSRKQCDELIEMIPRFNDYTGFSDLLSMQSSVAMLISGTDAINRFKQLFEGISRFLPISYQHLIIDYRSFFQ